MPPGILGELELGCVGLVGTSEFFETKHNVLQGLEVRNLTERRGLELSEQCLNSLRIEPLCDCFQTINPTRNRLQHLEDFPLDAGVANQLWLIDAAVLAEDAAIEGRANSLFHTQNALIEVVGLGSGR